MTGRDPSASSSAAMGDDDRHFVTALARGLDVLSAFRRGDAYLSNAEIAARCGLPRSTVSRLTYTLTRLGYLHHVDEVGRYRLGGQMLALGSVALGGLTVREIARPAMRDIADLSRASVALGVRDRLSMRYVECLRGSAAIALNMDVGSRLSMARSSMGRAYIAALTPAEREPLLDELRRLDTLAWPGLRAGVETALEDHARLGCCCSFGDWQETVSAIAVGFRPGGGLAPMAISCGAPTVITTPDFLLDVVRPRLVELARSLNGVMGA